eukprot:COSAG01_NODE_1447_length_10278_cov_47.625209_4_plen_80_part_00
MGHTRRVRDSLARGADRHPALHAHARTRPDGWLINRTSVGARGVRDHSRRRRRRRRRPTVITSWTSITGAGGDNGIAKM